MKPTFSEQFKSENEDEKLINHIQYLTRDLYSFMTGLIDLNNLPFQIVNRLVYVNRQTIPFTWADSNKKRTIIGVIPILTNGATLSDYSTSLITEGVSATFVSNLQVRITFLIIGA